MNQDSLEKVLPHLHIQTVYPTRIDAKVASWFDRRIGFNSFTRVNWSSAEISIAEIGFQDAEGDHVANLVKFLASTRTRIVRIGEAGIPGDQEDLNEDDVVLDLQVDFAVEYAIAGCKPEELPEDGMGEFANHNMPYHLWPYYRQFAQDMALRLQMPIPAIPSFRVKKSHQPKK